MSIGRPEKICPHDKGRWRRDSKRAIVKRLRIEGRRDPENAPRRIGYLGWST